MKNALLISGYLRGFIENIQSIKENVIQCHYCDIYIHITDDEKCDKYFNKNVSYDKIKQILKPKILLTSNNLRFSSDERINNLLNQNYKKYWLNEEMKKICSIENIKYDVVVQMRPDVNIKTRLSYEECADEYIQIPIDSKIDIKKLKNTTDKYICDMIAYGNPDIMNEYFKYYLNVKSLIKTYDTCTNEALLHNYLNDNAIKYKLVDVNYMVILSLCNTIAITGDSGSGKTTISNILKDILKDSFLLECDRYHKWERHDKNWQNYTHLNPQANYITKMCDDVFDLKIGNKIYQIDYDHASGKFTDKQLIEPKDNIIICGLHCLYMPDNIINLKIYMDTDDNLRIPWKINRDVKKRGYSIEKIYNQIKEREHDYSKYIKPQKEKANVIVRFYTDVQFDYHKHNCDMEYPVFLKIGIKSFHNLNKICNFDEIKDIEHLDDYIYINFIFFENYDNIIKKTIKEILLNL
jgi:uridine kinase